MHTHTFSEQIPRTGIWRQAARSQGRRDGAEVAPWVWDPKMFSSWVGIPKGSVPAPKHHQIAGQRGQLRRGWGGVGGSSVCVRARQPLSRPQAAHSHKESFQSYWLAGLLRLFFFQGLCPEYKSSSLLAVTQTGSSHQESDRE